MFLVLIVVSSYVAGSIAALAGFGIGSILTPVLSIKTGIKLAVAAISIPHLAGTALRLWLLRKHIDRKILLSFGVMSAAGGLIGAFLNSRANNPVLTYIFAGLLIIAGFTGVSGLARRIQIKGVFAWVAGMVSGMLGGLVGNQGGIRSAAMLGLDVPKNSFVATATAIALIVDLARIPVYLFKSAADIWNLRPLILIATVGVLFGTIGGERMLRRIPETVFRRIISLIILVLGIWMLVRGEQ